MKRLSNINESLWKDSIKRGRGEEIRKEDIIGNIREIKWVDIGDDVLWADRDFEMDEKKLFSYKDMRNIEFPNGICIPSYEDFENLLSGEMGEYVHDHVSLRGLDWELGGVEDGMYTRYVGSAGFFMSRDVVKPQNYDMGMCIEFEEDYLNIKLYKSLCDLDEKIQVRLVKKK